MIGILMLGSALAGPIQASGPTLTLDQAIQIAEQNAFSVKTAQSAYEKVHQEVLQAKGMLGPDVKLGATYTRFDKETKVQFGNANQPIIVSPIQTKVATASVSMPIDISGEYNLGIRAADATLRSSQASVEAARSDLRRAVTDAYLAVLRAKAQVQVAQQSESDEEDRMKNVQEQKNAGTLAQVDVLRQEAELSQSKADLITAQNALEISKESLNNTIARPIETQLDVQETDGLPEIPQSPDAEVKQALDRRPELQSIRETRVALHAITKATATGLLPTLQVAINYTRNLTTGGFGSQPEQTVGTLSLSFPIWDSGVTHAKIGQARQDEVQAEIQQNQLELSISLEVRQAVTNLQNAKQRYDVAQSQVTYAEETYRLARIKLAAGQGILLEVTDAETALSQARNGLVNARYDYLTAYADLQRAIGADVPQIEEVPQKGEPK